MPIVYPSWRGSRSIEHLRPAHDDGELKWVSRECHSWWRVLRPVACLNRSCVAIAA
jgi:hypothetical protein